MLHVIAYQLSPYSPFASSTSQFGLRVSRFYRRNPRHTLKNEITVRFGKDEDTKATQYATLARGQGYEPEQKVSVHAGTLRVALEDLHTRGGQIPSEYFSTFAGYQTKITNKSKSTD